MVGLPLNVIVSYCTLWISEDRRLSDKVQVAQLFRQNADPRLSKEREREEKESVLEEAITITE